MTIQQNFQQRPKTLKEFTATGVLVTAVPTTMCNKLRVVVENVGGGNTIVVKGKLFPQTAWQTLATINGATTGTTVDISVVDEYQIECSAYAASGGTPKVIASAFFNQASGGSGSITGASNVGTAGVGVFDAESGGVLNFRNVNAGSTKITVSYDATNKEIDIDADETQFNVRNLDNVSPGINGSFAGWSDSGELASVPGFTFDDIGSLRVGAQNSITVPAGVTDYYSLGISPTITNPGMVNLASIQLNSPINASVTNYNGFVLNGYGTSVPLNFLGFNSNANYSGTGTSASHFEANHPWDITGTLTGFKIGAAGDAQHLQGFELIASGSYTSISGLKIDLSSATSTGRKAGIEVTEGTFASSVTFSTTSSLPTLVDSGNVIRPIFEVKAGSPITGTDVLMSNLAGFMDIKDNYSGSALGLGVASVGFVSQVAVTSGKTASNVSMLTAGLAVDSSSTGGTVTDLHLIRGFAANFGGSLTIGTIYGLQIETGISALATTAFGISVEDTGAENYLAKSLVVSGSTKTVTNSDIAIEINGAKAFRLGRVTTAQRLAMTPLQGVMVYDTDTNKPYHGDGTSWHQF